MSKGAKALHGLPEELTKTDKKHGRTFRKKVADNVMHAYFSTRTPTKRMKGSGKLMGVNAVAQKLGLRYSDALRLVRAARAMELIPGNI